MSVSRRVRRRRLAIVVSLVGALMVPAGAAVAQDAATVSFVGAGWGHGLGLSQYGAYGAARDGWTAEQIIEHFYQGSHIGTMGQDDPAGTRP